MIDVKNSIMQRLKTETRDLHSHAESRTLQRAMAGGEVDRTAFCAYLGQLHHVHSSLESALDSSRGDHPAIAAIATVDRMRVPDLDRDLSYFGIDPRRVPAGDAARRFSQMVGITNEANPIALLGALYVVEGSTNGGRFLARALSKSWGLDGEGLSYFDPYGEEQRRMWASFREQMGEASIDADQEDAIVEMAKTTFLAIAEVSDEVSSEHA